jgi:hypothetical protein
MTGMVQKSVMSLVHAHAIEVKIRLHTEYQLPRLSRTALIIMISGGGSDGGAVVFFLPIIIPP